MPLFFVPLLGLMGIAIAMIRRSARSSPAELREPQEALAARSLRWAVGQLPGRGRTPAGVWAMLGLTVGSVGLDVAVAIHYQLGGGEWIAATILTLFSVVAFFGASALLRRPDVAHPGLVGGVFVALAWLTLSGFTFLDQVLPDVMPWHALVITVVVPLIVGATGTLWSGDAMGGKRIAQLAAIVGGLSRYVYATVAVAAVGGSAGLDAEGGGTLRGTISDRLGNNLVLTLVVVTVTTTVGWGGAAATGAFRAARMRRDRRPPARLALVCVVAAAFVVLAAASWLRG